MAEIPTHYLEMADKVLPPDVTDPDWGEFRAEDIRQKAAELFAADLVRQSIGVYEDDALVSAIDTETRIQVGQKALDAVEAVDTGWVQPQRVLDSLDEGWLNSSVSSEWHTADFTSDETNAALEQIRTNLSTLVV